MSTPCNTSTAIYLLTKSLGTGGVGTHFLSQLQLLHKTYPHISLVAVTRSSKAISTTPNDPPLSLKTWEKDLAASSSPGLSISQILSLLKYHNKTHRSIVVDNTSSQEVAESYPLFLQDGISIVTPNKKGFSGEFELWRNIFIPVGPQPRRGLVYHESSVGAGLPIISTLNDLVATGDKVSKIEGVFSGTMSYLFNTFSPVSGASGRRQWSEIVSEAKAAGFTEPDPRDDLNGVDVARKLVILARLCGLEVAGVDAFPVESLIPKELATIASADEFMKRLPEFDGQMEEVNAKAGKTGKVVRFVGSIDVQKRELKVGMEEFDKGHPIAGLKGADNWLLFTQSGMVASHSSFRARELEELSQPWVLQRISSRFYSESHKQGFKTTRRDENAKF